MADNAGRTKHGIPAYARRQAAGDPLIVGVDEKTTTLSPDTLAGLPRLRFLDLPMEFPEGSPPPTNWSGYLLRDVIAVVAPGSGARWVLAESGPYSVAVDLRNAANVLLCDRLDDAPLPVQAGGPWRLVIPDERYFTSVKWLERLKLSTESPAESVHRIIAARRRARDAKAGQANQDKVAD